jgi:hypothetical protein
METVADPTTRGHGGSGSDRCLVRDVRRYAAPTSLAGPTRSLIPIKDVAPIPQTGPNYHSALSHSPNISVRIPRVAIALAV